MISFGSNADTMYVEGSGLLNRGQKMYKILVPTERSCPPMTSIFCVSAPLFSRNGVLSKRDITGSNGH